MTDKEELWAELDALGEDAVRLRLRQQVYGARKRPLVEEWLEFRSRDSSRAIDSSRLSDALANTKINRISMIAMVITAIAAVAAATISVVSLIISLRK